MRELRSAHGEVYGRVWDGELPPVSVTVVEELEDAFPAPAPAPGRGPRRAAVEWWQHLGPVYRYGLLGAEFTPAAPGQLRVQVAVSPENGPAVAWALPQHETVAAGLPRHFAGAALRGVRGAEERGALGAGTLRFACAAHSPISSVEAVFEMLARRVIELLVNGDTAHER